MALTALGRDLTEQHRRGQVGLAGRYVAGATILSGEIDPARIDLTLTDTIGLLVTLTESLRRDSERLALSYLPAYRDVEAGSASMPLAAPGGFDAASTARRYALLAPMAKKRIGQGMAPREAIQGVLTRLSGVEMETVLNGGRRIVDLSALANPDSVGWRRVTDGEPCAFCAMLAMRGPAYESAETAGEGRVYHARCGCTVEEVFGQWLPSAQERSWLEAYAQAEGAKPSDATRAIRRHANVSDAHRR